MPVVTFDYNDFKNLLGYDISKDNLIKNLPMIGADFDKEEDDELSIEFFPDRPDLLSVEGIARASRNFFGFTSGLQQYKIQSSDIILNVESSVKNVRPFIRCALVKNVTMTDELISSLMDLQEKLHYGIGRNRKKVAIGVHNYESVQPPFIYKAVDPNSVQFIPLAKTDSMTMSEILEKHEKGIAYAHLLKDFEKHPIIFDKNNNVLSYPPIINGTLTEVTPFTTDLFIDVTGTNAESIEYALNIVTTALAERGGTVYSIKIIDDDKNIISPSFTPKKRNLSTDYVNKILGTKFDDKQIITCMQKMGYNIKIINQGLLEIEIPSWRADILHEIDLVEDVAIGYGYQEFHREVPKASTFGQRLDNQKINDVLRTIMIGLGYNEVTTFTISNENDEFKKIGLQVGKKVDFQNPISEEYSCIRVSLIPSLLKILAENKHHPLPQNIFELGIIVDDSFKNKYHLALISISANAHFTESKALTETIFRNIGLEFKIQEKNHPGFITGRCASILIKNDEIGFFGELHPKTITSFELEHPILAIEIDIEKIKKFL
jgi:phenylalanyl-tRNA synthetase beta chain